MMAALRLALASIGALVAAMGLAGCGGPGEQQPDWPDPSPALWQVTGPEGQQAWLFGTVHALPEGLEWQTDAVDQAFDAAGVLVVEIADLGDNARAFPIFERFAYSSGLPPLTRRVTGEEREAVRALLRQAGRGEGEFVAMESWAAALVLAGGVRYGDPELGVDRVLLSRGKQAIALESFEHQFSLFDGLPRAEQDDLLVAVAHEAARSDPLTALAPWITGDMAALEGLAREGMLGDPELRAALLDGRNAEWVERLVPVIDNGREPFVAVGAAHMLGDGGLPALLAARGYRVTRIQ